MDRKSSNPLLDDGGFFVGRDLHRSFMVNGAAYARQMNRKPEPAVSFEQSLLMGICITCFVAGVLLVAAGVS